MKKFYPLMLSVFEPSGEKMYRIFVHKNTGQVCSKHSGWPVYSGETNKEISYRTAGPPLFACGNA